jgi:hypothetical protein
MSGVSLPLYNPDLLFSQFINPVDLDAPDLSTAVSLGKIIKKLKKFIRILPFLVPH